MEIRRIRCDWCNQDCEGDSFTVFRNDISGHAKGKSDYCEKCWSKMYAYLYKKGGNNK